jgi:hypothetical protein
MLPRPEDRRQEVAPKRKPPERGTLHVEVTADLWSEPVFLTDGHVVPSSIPAWADMADGTTVTLDIEVSDGRARAVKVSVESARGIGWTTLANVPTRDLVATAILTVIQRATVKPNGQFALAPPAKGQEQAAWEVVRALVGYEPNTAGLDRELAS